MSYTVVAQKLKSLPEYYLDEISDFIDFLLSKVSTSKINGLDQAIEEVRNGEVETFNSFEDFKAAMSR